MMKRAMIKRPIPRGAKPAGMTLYAANRSSFTWQIAHSAGGGFDASFRVERRVDGQPRSESGTLHVLSRDIALVWLRVEATVRGFDGRGVK
jgi:hypothetical protein